MLKLVILSCLAAAASAAFITPLASPFVYNAPLFAPYNYRGPLSLAPGQPANVLAADGRPLDTLDVNLDRSAHYTAKVLDGSGLHLLKKRSVLAPFAYNNLALHPSPILTHSAPFIAPAAPLPISHYTPYSYSYPTPYGHAF